MVSLKVLVQRKNELDVDKINEFIKGIPDAKVVLIYSSVSDERLSKSFFRSLAGGLSIPFVATRVSGTVTNEAYVEDSVVAAVLCGGFDVRVFCERIIYDEPGRTAEGFASRLGGWELCLIYSANYYDRNVLLDAVLRGVQGAHPRLQFFGGVSAPPPIVATKDGVFEDHVACVSINGAGYNFEIDSGFRFDRDRDDESVITKSDEHYIYEVDGRSAVDWYSGVQCMRPYFINMLASMLPRPNTSKLMKRLSGLNEALYRGVLAVCVHTVGCDLGKGVVEFLFTMDVDEKKNRMVVQSYKSEGTVLKRIMTSKEDQLAVYGRLHGKFPKAKAVIINSCHCSVFWLDFNFKTLSEEMRKFNCPVVLSFVYGGLGATMPYGGTDKNVLHVGTIKALGFR